MEEVPQLDENTVETLKMIHKELELEDAVDEDINWEDMKPMQVDPVDMILERVNSLKDRIYKKFKKSKSVVEEIVTGREGAEWDQIFEIFCTLHLHLKQTSKN